MSSNSEEKLVGHILNGSFTGIPSSVPPGLENTPFGKLVKERLENPKPGALGLYDLGRTIGEGNFAKVKLGTHALTGIKVAVKVIEKTKLSKQSATKLAREVKIMKMLNHPHICRLYEVIETTNEVYLIMEFAEGGELFDYLVAHGRMKERDARKHFRQIVSAMDYCHNLKIIHRDLKAENLLLDNDMNAKIADFGFSNQFQLGQTLNTWCGSPPYAAPELFLGKEYCGPEIDIWSLGVVLYVLVCGALPFDGQSLTVLRQRVLAGKFKVPYFMSPECERLIKRMLVLDPAGRLTLEEVKNDPWMNEGYNVLPPCFDEEIKYTEEQKGKVFAKMESLGINKETVLKSLEEGGYDHVAAAYHLLCDKFYARKPIESNFSARRSLKDLSSTAILEKEEDGYTENGAQEAAPKQPTTPKAAAPAPSPPAVDVTKTKRNRRHTVNTRPVDVAELRKDLLKKVHDDGRATPTIIIPNNLMVVSAPNSPVGVASETSPDGSGPSSFHSSSTQKISPAPSSPQVPTTPTTPHSSHQQGRPSSPIIPVISAITAEVKKKRGRAISLSTSSRPIPPPIITTPRGGEASPVGAGPSSPLASEFSSDRSNSGIISSSSSSQEAQVPTTPLTPTSEKQKVSLKERLRMKLKRDSSNLEPRSLRFHFSVSTTSSKDPAAIMQELTRVLAEANVQFEKAGFVVICRYQDVCFEMEVCKLPRLSLNGLRFKRIAGNSWNYKNLCTDLISKMKL